MLNKVMLIGQLGQDPSIRVFQNLDQQVTVSLATSRRWKDKNTGERKEKTSWHNLVFNRGLAKVAADYLKKGSKIYVSGEIDYQEWEDKQTGEKKYRTVIIADTMHMLDSKGGGNGKYSGQNNGGNASQGPASAGSAADNYDDFDGDIPF